MWSRKGIKDGERGEKEGGKGVRGENGNDSAILVSASQFYFFFTGGKRTRLYIGEPLAILHIYMTGAGVRGSFGNGVCGAIRLGRGRRRTYKLSEPYRKQWPQWQGKLYATCYILY